MQQQVNIEYIHVPAKVARVVIQGKSHASNDLFHEAVDTLMRATTLSQIIAAMYLAKNHLDHKQIFKDITFHLDASADRRRGDFDVIISLTEEKRFELKTDAHVGNQDGSLMLSGRMRNYFGHAESFAFEYDIGLSKKQSTHVTYTKPLRYNHAISAALYKNFLSPNQSTPYSELTHGLTITRMIKKHGLAFDAQWRELGCPPEAHAALPAALRGAMGHSFKTSISHSYTSDKRDSLLFPTRGYCYAAHNELSGLVGDAHFYKSQLRFQAHKTLLSNLVGSFGFQTGALLHHRNDSPKISLHDQFRLGGPASIRGYEMNGLGPLTGGNHFYAFSLSVNAQIPNLKQDSVLQMLHFCAFASLANIAAIPSPVCPATYASNLLGFVRDRPRVALGIGLALDLKMARAELNYCLPLFSKPVDRPKPGLQFGVTAGFQ